MKSIGFGLERVALLGVARPWIAAALLALIFGIAGYGLTKLRFDDNLRNVFGGSTTEFAVYAEATRQFVDPENQLIVLVEGASLAETDTFERLRELQFELQFLDGVADVFSLFALRSPPEGAADAPLLVDESTTELSPENVDLIRSHPILGEKLLSADASAMIYFVTPAEPDAPLTVSRQIKAEIEILASDLLAGTATLATVTGFPAVRISVVDVLVRDQRVLNVIGATIGFAVSLAVFGSLTGAIMTALPAVLSALMVVGWLGAFGLPTTVMSNVVPVLVMILGFANSMHLCRAWRLRRDDGASLAEAALHSIKTVGPACILAALTTSVAFLSLAISDLQVISDFGRVGAVGVMAGALVVLLLHGFLTVTIGRYWRSSNSTAGSIMDRLASPSAEVGKFAADYARSICFTVFALVLVLGGIYAAVKPEYSIRENLSQTSPTNVALSRIDQDLGGANPVHVIVPLGDASPTAPVNLEKISDVHRAVAAIDGVATPLSAWSLVEWLGTPLDTSTQERLDLIFDDFAPTTKQRFFGGDDRALVSVSIGETPTAATEALIGRIEAAARSAGGDDVIVTGATVITAREATRTIGNLNANLLLAILSGLFVILLAFRSWRIAATSVVPNILPLLGTGALIYYFGPGMQFSSVLALTVAFGIAVDGTIHYFNYFFHCSDDSRSLRDTLVETTRRIGPQLFGTTAVIVSGLVATQTSEMPTVALFGILAAATLLIALVGDLVVLPALMAGAARRWFTGHPNIQAAARGAA